MSVAIPVNNKTSVINRFKGLDLSNSHAIVSSARKGLKPKLL